MRGIVGLKAPLELNFEGISEIKKFGDDDQDTHDFPLTTRFINLEMTRSRAATKENGAKNKNKKEEQGLLSMEEKNEELRKLFQGDIKVPDIGTLDSRAVTTPMSTKVYT